VEHTQRRVLQEAIEDIGIKECSFSFAGREEERNRKRSLEMKKRE
jgi:hypothetical protein